MPARQPIPISRPLPGPSSPTRPQGNLFELGCKLGVNALALLVALGTLATLVPRYRAQQARLQAIRAEVGRTERRVARLQARLERNLDPRQAETVMQEQTARVRPQLWPIVFLGPGPTAPSGSSAGE